MASLPLPLNVGASGQSGASTPRTIPAAGDQDDDHNHHPSYRRHHHMHLASPESPPSSLRKSGSSGEAGTSVSPEVDGFIALHTTLSGDSLGAASRASLISERDLAAINLLPAGAPEPSLVAEGTYIGGAELTHARTAPQVSLSTLENDQTINSAPPEGSEPGSSSLPQSPTRTTFQRPSHESSTPRERLQRSRYREGRGSRPRAATASHLTDKYLSPVSPAIHLNPRNRPQPSLPSPTPQSSLQSHLYHGLLNATLSDLHIVAFGRLYRLHRIILAGQSGFFTSLLSGGFSEERQSPLRRKRHARESGLNSDHSADSIIPIELDAPMTRAAFEFCLAKLYGGGPTLQPPPWAHSTPAHPLSEPFEALLPQSLMHDRFAELASWATTKNNAHAAKADSGRTEDNCQLATPDFILSLLATSTYLEIPPVQHLALEMIQVTLTPWTIGTYLAYATGRYSPAAMADEPCHGLEGVGTPFRAESESKKSSGSGGGVEITPGHSRTPSNTDTDTHSTASPYISQATSSHGSTSGFEDDASEVGDDGHEDDQQEAGDMSVFVGPEGERVGEACACWLSKWGGDVLSVEEEQHQLDAAASTASADATFQHSDHIKTPPLRLWSSLPGGLSARWVRGVISSDAFFMSTKAETPEGDETGVGYSGLGSDLEFHRYLFARRVVLMRRREKQQHRRQQQDKNRSRKKMGKARLDSATTGDVTPHLDGTDNNDGLDGIAERTERVSLDHEAEQDGMKCGSDGFSLDDHDRESAQGANRGIDEGGEDDEDCEDDDRDETEYRILFSTGIRFTHMTFRQLQYISQDRCPVTGNSYVSQAVIERAFWRSETFKYQLPISVQGRNVTHYIYGSGTRTPGGGDSNQVEEHPELGLTVGIDSNLDSRKQKRNCRSTQPYFLVPIDDTTRINERVPTSEPELLSDEPGASYSPSPQRKDSTLPRGAEGFFGLGVQTRRGTLGCPKSAAVVGTAAEEQLERRFVAHEPFRTSVEFWLGGVNALKDKQRVYSSTFFFAGSFYNLYLQKIQKKGSQQLGIYLHRQNPNEPFPVPSQPPTGQMRLTPSVLGSLAPYTDRRKSIKAFFSIWCPNVLGNSLTKFSSGPDTFALSQSWGWKSTSLSSEFLTTVPENTFDAYANRLSSLRVTVVIGLV